MTLNQYQELAKGTDCRDEKIKMICNGFGLIGELEEYKECSLEDKKNIIKESGDVMWYCSSICSCLGADLQEVCNKEIKEIDRPIAEVFKKAFRDNKGVFDKKYKEDILTYVNYVINWILPFGTKNLEEIMQANIDKLYSRKQRGVIKGDGDNR